MLVHNLVVTGSLTFPTALPISGSLLVSGSTTFNGTSTFSSPDLATDGLGNVNIFTTDAAAIGKGGSLSFGGGTTGGTSPYVFAKIEGVYNGSAAYDGTLIFSTNRAGTIAEKMRISNSGSVGIGTTVLGWDDALITALQIKNASFYGYSTNELGIACNAQVQGGWKYISAGSASYQVSAGGGHAFYTAPSGNASASVTWTERFAIANNGAATFTQSGGSFSITSDGQFISKQNLDVATAGGRFTGQSARGTMGIIQIEQATTGADGGKINFEISPAGSTTPARVLTIINSGQFSQGATISDWSYVMTNNNASSPNGMIIQYTGANKNNNSNHFLYCTDNFGVTLRHGLQSNGGIANFQANDVNLSDERTKKDITPLESYWNKFKDIEIVKFKYKDQTHDDFNIGVIAQQVEEIAPEFVETEGWGKEDTQNEEPLKSIYTADLYHATIKVLQEAMTKIEEQHATIETLTTRITALEN